jgi:two-component system, OmpR family, response regulator ChvI
MPPSTGSLKIDSAITTWRDMVIDFTPGELRVLTALTAAQPGMLTFREVYDAVRRPGFAAGRGEDGYRTNVRSTIKRLRIKFRTVDPAFDCIKTRTGFGYRWEEA